MRYLTAEDAREMYIKSQKRICSKDKEILDKLIAKQDSEIRNSAERGRRSCEMIDINSALMFDSAKKLDRIRDRMIKYNVMKEDIAYDKNEKDDYEELYPCFGR